MNKQQKYILEYLNPNEIELKNEMLLDIIKEFEAYYDNDITVLETGFTFDAESAIYWFCSDYHAGQNSDLYSILSTSEYSPGPMCKNIYYNGNSNAIEMYSYLIDNYKEKSR